MYRRIFGIGTLMLIAVTVDAQRPGEQRPGAQQPDQQRPEGRVFGGPPGFHLATAIDTDADGKISTQEIENASAALQKLDKNKDGKLSGQEIGWPPTSFGGFGRGPGGPPGFGGGRGGPPGGGFGGRGGFGGGGFGGQQGGPARRPSPQEMEQTPPRHGSDDRSRDRSFFTVKQLKSTDRNRDGKITKDEIPKLLQESVLDRVDTNKDGLIDPAELDAFAKQQTAQK